MRPSKDQLETLKTFREEMDWRLGKILPLAGEVLAAPGGISDKDKLNALFRELHSLKGASFLIGEKPITEVVHQLEDKLARVRDDGLPLTKEDKVNFTSGLERLERLNQILSQRLDHGIWGF